MRGIIAGRRDGVRYISITHAVAHITAKAFNGYLCLIAGYLPAMSPSIIGRKGKFDYDAMNLMVEGLQIVGKQRGPVQWPKMIEFSFCLLICRTDLRPPSAQEKEYRTRYCAA